MGIEFESEITLECTCGWVGRRMADVDVDETTGDYRYSTTCPKCRATVEGLYEDE